MKIDKKLIIAILIFFLTALVLTWPIILNLSSKIYATYGDPYGMLHGFYASIDNPISYSFPNQAPIIFFGKYLSIIFSESVAYNLIVIFQFTFTAIPFYLIAKKFTKNETASLLSGLLIAVSPYRMAQAAQHLNLSNIGFIGFFIYFLIESDDNPKLSNFLCVSLSFIIGTLESYQYGFFMAIIATCFVIAKLIIRIASGNKFIFEIKKCISVALVVLISLFVVGFSAKSFFVDLPIFGGGQITSMPVRNSAELNVYSAKSFYYLFPSPQNNLLGKLTKEKYQEQVDLLGTNETEQIDYIGWTLIILTIIFFALRNKVSKTYRKISIFWIVLGAVALAMSFSERLHLFSYDINSIGYHVFKIVPFFRVYARLGILTYIAVASLAILGFDYIYKMIVKRSGKVVFTSLVAALILTEFIVLPTGRITPVDFASMPPVYKELASAEGNFEIAEYPLMPNNMPLSYNYLLWQRQHKIKLFNLEHGSDAGLLEKLYDISLDATVQRLKDQKIKYVIVHQSLYSDQAAKFRPQIFNYGIKPEIKSEDMILIKDFGADQLYELK